MSKTLELHTDLDSELHEMNGLAQIALSLGERNDSSRDTEIFNYIGVRLFYHVKAAQKACDAIHDLMVKQRHEGGAQ